MLKKIGICILTIIMVGGMQVAAFASVSSNAQQEQTASQAEEVSLETEAPVDGGQTDSAEPTQPTEKGNPTTGADTRLLTASLVGMGVSVAAAVALLAKSKKKA